MIEFPKEFLWGTATSAYQVEGNNLNSDWWEWEKMVGLKERSGLACRHYELYAEDFDLAHRLNHNAHRFSIEWSRIEPQEYQFAPKEIQHYKEILIALRERNLEPIVTLHHFTLPLWFARQNGWLNKKAQFYFLRYVETIVSSLCPYVHYWVTINEPLVYIYNAYISGIWPPQERSIFKAKIVLDNLTSAHLGAYKTIKQIYKDRGLNPPSISIAKHLREFISTDNNPCHCFTAFFKDYVFNSRLLNNLISLKYLDFIGINYYTCEFTPGPGKKFQDIQRSNLGWPIYPGGLFYLLLRLKRYNLPIFILENGISSDDDQQRWDFISGHLKVLYEAMQQGVRIWGYLYWSLLDNFEWEKGFGPRFGLIEMDYKSYRRNIRGSAEKLAEVFRTGRL